MNIVLKRITVVSVLPVNIGHILVKINVVLMVRNGTLQISLVKN